jgi:hypothetical protein
MTDPNPLSILDSVKKILGLDVDYTEFDLDVVMHINTAFMNLQQLAVGPVEGFTIADNTKLWTDFTEVENLLSGIQSYIYLRVRMLFDPPTLSFVIDAMQKQIAELEWRLNVQAEQIDPPTNPYTHPAQPYAPS